MQPFDAMKQLVFLLTVAALGGCQKQAVTPEAAKVAASTLTQGQVVRSQVTYNYSAPGPHPARFRWIIQLDPPVTVAGAGNYPFSVVKTFSLADTATYRAGTRLAFTYQVVPWTQQTPWLSQYEWLSAAPSPGYLRNPELTLADVQLR